MEWYRFAGLLAPLPALLLLAVSVVVSLNWWGFTSNAFSDLGNPRYSLLSSILFNTGLYTSSILVLCYAFRSSLSAPVRAALASVGFSLGLVAVFNEEYGAVHFAVSVAFFTSIIVFVLAYGFTVGGVLVPASIASSALMIVVWYLHLARNIPEGAAPPELLSIIIMLAFYYHAWALERGEQVSSSA